MEEGEIREGSVPFHSTKLFLKRLFDMDFRYKCLECGKGHDGYIMHIKSQNGVWGFTKASDFCSNKCGSAYIFKHGYSLKQRITDEKDVCIICGKEHNNQFVNLEQKYSVRAFCSKKCLDDAYKIVSKMKNRGYRNHFKKILDLFKEGKTIKYLEKGEPQYFQNIIIDKKELINSG